MSAALDYQAGGDAGYTGGVGPQMDGTYGYPVVAPQPTDAGGGAAATYGQTVLDVFKYGVGAYTALQQQQNMLDYRRWEATSGGLTQQGRASGAPGVMAGGMGGNAMLLLVGVVALALVLHHG